MSDSEEEEPDESAEEAAVLAAELDGAQVERIDSGRNAGGEPSTFKNSCQCLFECQSTVVC